MNIFIGTSGWSYDHWKKCFYPPNLPQKNWFQYYADHFNSVEVNATFYRRFSNEVYNKWRKQAPEGFVYVLKVPRLISHQHQLKNTSRLISEFSRSSKLLGEKFGLFLLQLPPNLPYEPQRLEEALCAFGETSRVAVEIRANAWLTDKVFALLKKYGAIYCNSDSPQRELTAIVTAKRGYLRLHGRREWYADNYQLSELKHIANSVKKMDTNDVKEVYIFFNNDYHAYAPDNALTLCELLAK